MSETFGECLVDVYVTSMELLGTTLQIIEGPPRWSRIEDDLRTASVDAVLFSRSFTRAADLPELTWKVDQVLDRFRTAGGLLRKLRANGRGSPHLVAAGIEVAERGVEAVTRGKSMLAATGLERPDGPPR